MPEKFDFSKRERMIEFKKEYSLETEEGVSENKKILRELEQSGDYVFHGSPLKVDLLEPRQAYNCNEQMQQNEEDGQPAVIGTPYADIAIFRSIVNSFNTGGEQNSEFEIDFDEENNKTTFVFKLSKDTLEKIKEKAKDIKGYIYVCNKRDFEKEESLEYRKNSPIKPIKVIEVKIGDLPTDLLDID